MIFVPGQYWGNGREAELKSLNENLPFNLYDLDRW